MYRLAVATIEANRRVLFDEVIPSDIPVISGIDRVIHKANGVSPDRARGKTSVVHAHGSDDNLMVLQGERFIDIYCPKQKKLASFIERRIRCTKMTSCTAISLPWSSGLPAFSQNHKWFGRKHQCELCNTKPQF